MLRHADRFCNIKRALDDNNSAVCEIALIHVQASVTDKCLPGSLWTAVGRYQSASGGKYVYRESGTPSKSYAPFNQDSCGDNNVYDPSATP